MEHRTPHLFLIAIILLCASSPLHADEIHLKNGKIIETERVWQEGNAIKYEKYGGTISIARKRVKEVVSSKAEDRPAAEEQTIAEENAEPSPSEKNLAAQLRAALRPKNPAEEASMCTISVKSAGGHGSGFFISDDGFIITNKHVVRGSEQQGKKIDREFEQAEQNLREFKQYLDQLRTRNSSYKADLKRKRALLKEMWKQNQSKGNKKYIAVKKKELNSFAQFIRRAEKKEKKEYRVQKQNFDKQFKSFRSGRRRLSRQNSFEIILADETKLYAELYKLSNQHDLALLKITGYKTPYLKPVLRKDLAQGQNVFAVGSPIDLKLKNTVTSGVLSGFRDNFIQTNAQIYPGNSGGPLINKKGEVVGINTKKLLTEKFEGLGFAIPISIALAEFDNYLQQD